MYISEVIERKDVFLYLKKRRLLGKYKKAKGFLLSGDFVLGNLKKREPKKDEIWSFRVDKQFRAFCYFDGTVLVVFEINNHKK